MCDVSCKKGSEQGHQAKQNWIIAPKLGILIPTEAQKESMKDNRTAQIHQENAEKFYRQAQVQAEKNGDSELSGQLILQALKQERLFSNLGPQIVDFIKKG